MSLKFPIFQTSGGEKVKDKIAEADRKKINEKCDETSKWLNSNQSAEKDE